MTKDKMTLEKLARMVADGFAHTAQKEETAANFKAVNDRLDALDLHLAGYASLWREEFERLEKRVETFEKRLHALETKKR